MRPIFDNKSLIEWLGKKAPTKRYDYMDGSCCLIAQYLQYRGIKDAAVDSKIAILPGRESASVLPDGWNAIARTGPWTFGAALTRAKERLA
ncbi:hypothetical protein ACC806_34480 [Rhizobium ruizarguesonis]